MLGSHLKLLYLRVTVTTKLLHDQICAYSKSNRFPRSLVHENEKGGGSVRRLPHALHLVLGTTHPKKISWTIGQSSFISSRS